MNLLRGGNPTYLNYYGLVRPQLDFQQSLQGLQSQLSTTQSQLQAGPGAGGMQSTGHSVRFLNTGGYFLTLGRGGAGGGFGGAGGTRPGGVGGVGGVGVGGVGGMPSLRR